MRPDVLAQEIYGDSELDWVVLTSNNITEDFCFLYTGHWLPGSFGEDRKNVATLIRTFLETFKGINKKKPALVLKSNKVNYSLLDREGVLKDINRTSEQFD